MPKHVNCPVEGFAGYVILHDPIPLATVWKWEEVLFSIGQLVKEKGIEKTPRHDLEKLQFPVLIECVAEWHLENVPENIIDATTFPGTLRKNVNKLIDWLAEEVMKLYRGNEMAADPNA